MTDALSNGKQEGISLGNSILNQGWTHVHFIAHSAGAGLIQAATDTIKNPTTGLPSTVIHETFLDPFVGFDFAGVTSYGKGADWADQYFTRDSLTSLSGPYTQSPLDYSYNVDVTQLDPNKIGSAKFFSSQTGQMEPCYKTLPTHKGPYEVYQNTITGSVTPDYDGFGFPLSEEAGNWAGRTAYTVGNQTALSLGTPDPTCITDIQITPPSYLNIVPDFTQLPTIQSDTGTIQKYIDHLNLLSGSPAWLATVVTPTNPVNVINFDAQFISSAGAQGLLTVLWDENTIGTVDERAVSGLQHYQFRFPNAAINSTHVLGLRIDPFTNIQTKITLTNIVLNQIGVSQPFSLTVTTNIVNSSLVYQLSGPAGFEYGIQASSNLIDWTTIATLVNTNGVVRFYDQGSTNYHARFYRGTTAY